MSQRKLLLVSLLLIRLLFSPDQLLASQSTDPHPCPDAETVPTNTTIHATLERDAHRARFLARLMVEESGFLAFDVTSPLGDLTPTNASQPRLTLLDTGCTDAARDVELVDETPGGLIVRVRGPGAVYVAVSANDPATPDPATRLGRFSLHTAFGAEPMVPDTMVTLDADPPAYCVAKVPSFGPEPIHAGGYTLTVRPGDWTRDVEPDDCDVIEGNFMDPGVVVVEAEGTPLSARLFAGRSCTANGWLGEALLGTGGALVVPVDGGWHRLVLDPLASGPMAYTLGVKHIGLCGHVRDDHADVVRCGTALDAGMPVEGALGDGVLADGDDRRDDDTFTFSLAEQMNVTLRVDTEAPVIGALFDHAGVRLAGRFVCNGEGCGLTVTLPAGRYGLRLSTSPDNTTPGHVPPGHVPPGHVTPMTYTIGYTAEK